MHIHQREAEANWLAGTMDSFGQVGIKKNTMFVKFKTVYPSRLEAIAAAIGIDRAPRGPFDNHGASRKRQYDLVLVGKELATLENLVTGRMRTEKQHLFQKRREQLGKLRKKSGLSGKYDICRAEDL